MEEKAFDRILTKVRQKNLPDCPANLEDNVLRKIRLQKLRAETSLIDSIYQHLFNRGFAVPVVAVAIVFSTFISSIAISHKMASIFSAAEALDFESIVEENDLFNSLI